MENYPTTGSASITVSATPAEVYDHLTDLAKLADLSPENVRCELHKDSDDVTVGARFRGYNKAGDYEWHADCVVTEADPGRSFAFEVPPGFEHATTWRYDLAASDDGGTVVTESFDAPLLALPDVYPGKIDGRCAQLQAACETTLANLKAAIEA